MQKSVRIYICSISVSEKNIPESIKKQNKENLKLMQDALATLGVRLNIKDGEISLLMHTSNFVDRKTRRAGRKRTYALKEQRTRKLHSRSSYRVFRCDIELD